MYVLLIRYYCKHDLLTRNYLHLYQRLQIQYKNYFYLAPCILNLFLSVLLIEFFSLFFNNLTVVSLSVSLFVTPSTYLYLRYRFVEPSYFFGDGN